MPTLIEYDLVKETCTSMSGNRHIVVVRFEVPLGTAVIATASLKGLKLASPDCKITVFASGHSLDLLQASPYVDHILAVPNPIKNPIRSFYFALAKVGPSRNDYDAIILDGGNRRSLITIFALLTGIKKRIGYSVRPWLLHEPVSDAGASSNIEINNKAFEQISRAGLKTLEPSIHFFRQDSDQFKDVFTHVGKRQPRIVIVTATSQGHPNAWYADRFVDLAKRLILLYDAFVILVGTVEDQLAIDKIKRQIGLGAISLAGQTTPRQLAALMAVCDFCISVDTGAMHIARSVSLPTVILANAAQPLNLWLPPVDLDHIEIIRKDHLPCSVCWKLQCSTKECMDEISTQEVVSAFARLKERVHWGDEARQRRLSQFTSTKRPS